MVFCMVFCMVICMVICMASYDVFYDVFYVAFHKHVRLQHAQHHFINGRNQPSHAQPSTP